MEKVKKDKKVDKQEALEHRQLLIRFISELFESLGDADKEILCTLCLSTISYAKIYGDEETMVLIQEIKSKHNMISSDKPTQPSA